MLVTRLCSDPANHKAQSGLDCLPKLAAVTFDDLVKRLPRDASEFCYVGHARYVIAVCQSFLMQHEPMPQLFLGQDWWHDDSSSEDSAIGQAATFVEFTNLEPLGFQENPAKSD